MLYIFSDGSPLVYYLTRLKFGWDEQDFTVWVSITSIASSFTTFCFMPLLSYNWKLHDTTIGIFGSLFGLLCNLVKTFAYHPWMFYLSSAVGLISYAPSIIIRSFISKVIPGEELGSVYSMLASLEACVPLVTSPIFTVIYQKTIDYFPAAILLISGLLFLLIMIHLIAVLVIVKSTRIDIQLDTENDDRTVMIDNEVLSESTGEAMEA